MGAVREWVDAHSIYGGLDPERTAQLRAFLLYLYDVETASQGLDFSSLSYQLYVYIFVCLSLSCTPSSIRTLLLRAIKVSENRPSSSERRP